MHDDASFSLLRIYIYRSDGCTRYRLYMLVCTHIQEIMRCLVIKRKYLYVCTECENIMGAYTHTLSIRVFVVDDSQILLEEFYLDLN